MLFNFFFMVHMTHSSSENYSVFHQQNILDWFYLLRKSPTCLNVAALNYTPQKSVFAMKKTFNLIFLV